MRTWWNSRHAGPRSRRAQAREGAIPSVRTNLSRRGWNVDTVGSNPAGRDCPCRCNSGRRDQSCGRAWTERVARRWRSPERSEWVSRAGALRAARRTTVDRAVLKNRCAASARGRATRPGRTNFSVSGGMHTRESQKLVGGSPCRCESCLTDHFSAASNKSNSPVSPTGNRSATLRAAAISGRLM